MARGTVGAGRGLGAAGEICGRADSLVAGLDGEVEVAAPGAEAVADVPVDERAGLGEDGGWFMRLVVRTASFEWE